MERMWEADKKEPKDKKSNANILWAENSRI